MNRASVGRPLALAVSIAALLGLLAWRAPQFFAFANLINLAVGLAPVLLVACGMTVLIIARQVDVSVGAQFCICGVVAGLLARNGVPLFFVALAAGAAGALFGSTNGWLTARLRLPSIVVTLATLAIGRESLRWLREGEFIRDLPAGFQWFGLSQASGQLLVLSCVAAAVLVLVWTLRNLALGRWVFAVGSDPEAARLAGLAPEGVVLGTFILLGALTGIAALLSAVRFTDVDPNAGAGLEMQAIAAAIAGGAAIQGGRGSLLGTLLAVILLGLIGPTLLFLHIEPHWEKALQGLIILTAVTNRSAARAEAS